MEKALRAAGIAFYSFKAADVDKFRKAVLGHNKNNKKDAESVARYAMALEAQGKLGNWKGVWSPDEALQSLTRSYAQRTKKLTREINRLWKLLRSASVDLYLALGGEHPDIDITENLLQQEGIVALLTAKPDIYEWKILSEADFLALMGDYDCKRSNKINLPTSCRKFQGALSQYHLPSV
ncbi:MAG: IS110 family transposase [Spirochaetota bacterium]